jgi:hypothetical protein
MTCGTAATLMRSRGVHPKVASGMRGHATVGITLDLYSHVTETMQRGAAASLAGVRPRCCQTLT